MTTTIVFVRAHYVDGHLRFRPGEEVPPGYFPPETVDQKLDQGALREYDPTARPSVYRLFRRFTGCAEEQPLTAEQLAAYTLEKKEETYD